MDATFDGDVVRAGSSAREQFYDARGYGSPRDGDLELAPVEAAHLLFRGDLAAVGDDRPGEGGQALDFQAFLASAAVSEVAFFVYKDLRDRGFYLTPAHPDRVADSTGHFVVYPRGDGPWDDTLAYRVRAESERASVPATDLSALAATEGATGVLAVVDEESELTYLELDRPAPAGTTDHDLAACEGELLSDRVVVWEAPATLHDRAFYGQPLDRDDGAVQLSLVEAAYLARADLLAVDGGAEAIADRGRAVEGDRFERRLRVYSALRAAALVPKTGFKFGADFRTYADVDSVDDLGHSELLVRALPREHGFSPRDLALDVRLAHGVRKRMVYALVPAAETEPIEWVAVERLTP